MNNNKEKTIITSIRIPEALHQKMKVALGELSQSKFILKILQEHLNWRHNDNLLNYMKYVSYKKDDNKKIIGDFQIENKKPVNTNHFDLRKIYRTLDFFRFIKELIEFWEIGYFLTDSNELINIIIDAYHKIAIAPSVEEKDLFSDLLLTGKKLLK